MRGPSRRSRRARAARRAASALSPAATTCRTRSLRWRWPTASGSTSCSVASALADFHGAERRFERHGEADGVLVVDDYGHHPTEIAAVLAAARATLGRRLIVAFQPHRYTRTQQLMDAFGPALHEADEIVLTDIYAAQRRGRLPASRSRRSPTRCERARAAPCTSRGSWTT